MSAKTARKRLDDILSDVSRAKDKMVAALQTFHDSLPASGTETEKAQIAYSILEVKKAHYSAVGVSEDSKEKILKELDK